MSAGLAAPAAAGALSTRVGVGVLGATGYAGAELLRLLAAHPGAALRAAGSRQQAGRRLEDALPALPEPDLVLDDDVEDPAAWRDRGVEAVFAALPHGAFAARARAFLDAGLRVVDLSADFRLGSAQEYRRHYQLEHPAPALLARAVYGLPEWRGAELDGARLVANPGCYATALLLAALPATAAGWWSGAPIVANAISGVSGAGRAPSATTHFAECGNSVAPYKVGESHAHLGEIERALGAAGAPSKAVVFNPHLAPMARGILASLAIPLARPVAMDEAQSLYRGRYGECGFVRLLPADALPETRFVRGSNRCDLAVRVAAGGTLLLVYAAIDNLVKGAAGQAIQNWNRMQGWPEATGLPLAAWSCA